MMTRKSWFAIGSVVLGSLVAFACTVEDSNSDSDNDSGFGGSIFGGVGGYKASSGGKSAVASGGKASTAKGGSRFGDISGTSTGGKRSSSSSSAGAAGDAGGGSQGGASGTQGGASAALGGGTQGGASAALGGGTQGGASAALGGGTQGGASAALGGGTQGGASAALGGSSSLGGSSGGVTTSKVKCLTGCASITVPVTARNQSERYGIRLESTVDVTADSTINALIYAPSEASGRVRLIASSSGGSCQTPWVDLGTATTGATWTRIGGQLSCELSGVTTIGILISSGDGSSYDATNSTINVYVDSISIAAGLVSREYTLATVQSVASTTTSDAQVFAPITGGGAVSWLGD